MLLILALTVLVLQRSGDVTEQGPEAQGEDAVLGDRQSGLGPVGRSDEEAPQAGKAKKVTLLALYVAACVIYIGCMYLLVLST